MREVCMVAAGEGGTNKNIKMCVTPFLRQLSCK